jgi:dTDP-4-dehydrorhamnose reductase
LDNNKPDATSYYGKTKALGEVNDNLTIRTSVIGPDLSSDGSELFNWFMKQKSSINGYTKSLWSGITTLELSKAVEALLYTDDSGIKNISSNVNISKFDLLRMINDLSNKNITINPVEGPIHNKCLIRTDNFIHQSDLSYEILLTEMFKDISSTDLYTHYQ